MRLGSSILGGKPMRIPGIVDVYQVGNEWVARSWPKQANQPNSAAQLLWRKKFKDAHTLVKTWTGAYMAAWQDINCPTGKMWIDIAIHSILIKSLHFEQASLFVAQNPVLYFREAGYGFGSYRYAIAINKALTHIQPFATFLNYSFNMNFEDVLKWNDLGWMCAKGKRPKKRWLLALKKPLTWIGIYLEGHIGGVQVYLALLEDCPNGVSLTRLDHTLPAPPTTNDYSLSLPPIKLFPEPFPY